MPCFTIRRATIDLGKVDPGHLKNALIALGFQVSEGAQGLIFNGNGLLQSARGGGYIRAGKVTYNVGTVDMQGRPLSDNTIKQAYSGEIVKATAKKLGWGVRESAPNQYVMVRR